ncbi:unnamed protein product [Fraxinus pennsylvanica]|uniref:Uncharacterized protein n=1 Tax=Fraxinus pennsylvanica TaxID=56036 RepID=A0AAD2AJI7_9LAMI|nr:unnamed protein product [Fraxinus pennsylvanica]
MASENLSQENGMEVAQVVVVMVPLLANGHLNQLLHGFTSPVSSPPTTSSSISSAPPCTTAKQRIESRDIHSITNVETYCFNSISAFCIYASNWEVTEKSALSTAAEILKELPSTEGCVPPEVSKFVELQQ